MSIYFETSHEGVKKSRKATGTIARWYTWAWFEKPTVDRRKDYSRIDVQTGLASIALVPIAEADQQWFFGGMSVSKAGIEKAVAQNRDCRPSSQFAIAPVTVRRTGKDIEEVTA